ncbi:MAG: ADP-forming succinate--CoA ligase subunit beta [Bdellovibrionales bacterium]
MNIHEYQAKNLFDQFGIATPKGYMATTIDEAISAAKRLGTGPWMCKAQIHAGGRGKGGGVKFCKTIGEVEEQATRMLGMQLVTHQTGPQGQKVKKIYIGEAIDIARELYLGLLVDRATGRITLMASPEGGMDIEEVSEKHPEKILKIDIDPAAGIQPHHCREAAFFLGLTGDQIKKATRLITNLYHFYIAKDVAIVEINPLAITPQGDVMVLDAKVVFDDNGLFRHNDIMELRDEAEEDPTEVEASKHSLSYVKLDGTIGCMVNGAGLAMATMDIIKLYGAEPANFLDVGGGADKERVTKAFKIILSDPNVKGILVNIFGGIMRCDIIAEGVIAAAKEVSLKVPLVVRLEGTNVDLGKKILSESGLAITAADNLADAADKVVKAVKKAS